MTFSGWETTYSHKLELMFYSELRLLGEWDSWIRRIDTVLEGMDYEDAMGCEFKDLLSLAGIGEREIELAQKQKIVDKRIEKLKEDF